MLVSFFFDKVPTLTARDGRGNVAGPFLEKEQRVLQVSESSDAQGAGVERGRDPS